MVSSVKEDRSSGCGVIADRRRQTVTPASRPAMGGGPGRRPCDLADGGHEGRARLVTPLSTPPAPAPARPSAFATPLPGLVLFAQRQAQGRVRV